jgi:hydroxymethylpyrimidine pyrophosphatase-like HAD family hydrolase
MFHRLQPLVAAGAAATIALIAASTSATTSASPCLPTVMRKRRILLLTDLDGTLVDKSAHSAQEIEAFNRYWNEHERPNGSVLVYNTARCINMYTQLVETNPSLMPPDVLITGEGTEIRWLIHDSKMTKSFGHDQVRFVPDAEWSEKIHAAWFKSNLRDQVLSTLNPLDCGKIPNLNDLCNAPPHGEARHAITVDHKTATEIEHVAQRLTSTIGKDKVKMFHVKGWIEDTELLTALPAFAGKDGAAKYVAKKLMFSNSDVLAAGDTKGDQSMVDSTNFAFICVGNGSEGLKKAWHGRTKTVKGDYMSMFGGAGGVLDGVMEFVRTGK